MLAAGSLLLNECYETLPVQQDVPPVATRVQLTLNDRGRAALSDQLGTAVDKIEGNFVAIRNDGYVIETWTVYQLNGNSAHWNGEKVSVEKQYTTGFQLRRLNAVKTTFVAAAVVAGITMLIFGKSLVLGGGAESPPDIPESHPTLRLSPVPR